MFKYLSAFLAIVLGFVFWTNSQDAKVGSVEHKEPQSQIEVETNGNERRRQKLGRVLKSKVPRKSRGRRRVQDEEDAQEEGWGDEALYQVLELNQSKTHTIDLTSYSGEYVTLFKFRVPARAKSMTLTVDEIPAVVNMYGLSGEPMSSGDDATDANPAEEFVITVSRFDYLAPLEAGWFYLAVEVDSDSADLILESGVTELDITVTPRVQLLRVDDQVEVGSKISSSLSPNVGCFRTFQLRIPENAEAVRLDLDRANADLNLLVRHKRQIVNTDSSDHYSEDIESRESLVIRRADFPNLDEGSWYVDVYASYNETFTPFDLYVTQGEKPPAELLALPELNLETTAAENAMLSTVQIATQSGSASGTLVSEDGLILTNYHVISEAIHLADLTRDESESDLVIAVSTDPGVPPIEYFLGEVIEKSVENDLALVRIKSGYYGQPLPEGYKFPWVQCRLTGPKDLGSPVRICGYPMSGSVENNPTYSISSGVLSGFLDDRYLKTDADIASGNSGGAGYDADWKLIGVPTMTIEDPFGAGPTMGIMMDLKLIPDSWGVSIQE